MRWAKTAVIRVMAISELMPLQSPMTWNWKSVLDGDQGRPDGLHLDADEVADEVCRLGSQDLEPHGGLWSMPGTGIRKNTHRIGKNITRDQRHPAA